MGAKTAWVRPPWARGLPSGSPIQANGLTHPRCETRSFGALWLIAFVVTLAMDVTRAGCFEPRREGDRISLRHASHGLRLAGTRLGAGSPDHPASAGGVRELGRGAIAVVDQAGVSGVRVERLDLPPPTLG